MAQQLRYTCLPFTDSVEQLVPAISQSPSVWALLEQDPAWALREEDTAHVALQWLLNDCFFGKLGSLKLLQTGETIPFEEDEEQLPHIRLETLIKITEQKRSKWIRNPNEILPEEILKRVLDEWKADYLAWMNQSSQNRWYTIARSQRHVFERQ